ncbi:hypothetical protein Cgig2_000935 [Carnegiea gigantea]|uniref:Uncharacterized protein n=1 Tax=Carnegiea gigantea TaxID=171969 RepID=A0A9Q1KMJ2_9CARY|nr:hypothetical protein Cgig2_000935 [Carnegiea gigantea]
MDSLYASPTLLSGSFTFPSGFMSAQFISRHDSKSNFLMDRLPLLARICSSNVMKLKTSKKTHGMPRSYFFFKLNCGAYELHSVGSTPDLCSGTSCTSKNKTKTFIGPVVTCAALFVLLLAASISFLVFTRRKKQSMKPYIVTSIMLACYGLDQSSYFLQK